MPAKTAAAPAVKNSAPNSAEAKAAAPDKKAWSAEIAKAPEYNGNLPVADVVPDPKNRKQHDPAGLQELLDMIKAEGLLQPIVLRPCPRFPRASALLVDKGKGLTGVWTVTRDTLAAALAVDEKAEFEDLVLYEGESKQDAERAAAIYRSGSGWQIIAGERRWRAHVLGKIPTIRAFIHRGETDISAVFKQVIENLGRKDLDPVEEARQMKRLEGLKVSQKEIGKIFGGRSQPAVANTLKLLALPVETQAMVSSGVLTAAHGVELARFARWPKICARIGELAHAHDWDAKSLREDSLPFAGTLESNDGLVVGINMDQGYDWETRPTYTLPAWCKEDPDFIAGKSRSYYILPADPKDSKWASEKQRQDDARAKAAAVKAQKKTKGDSKESVERARVLEKNKKRRTALKIDLERALEKLAKLKQPGAAELAVLAKHAVRGSYGSTRIHEVATALGLKVPVGAVAGPGSYGFGDINPLMKMSPANIAKLAVGVILHKDVDDLCKEPQGFEPFSLKVYGVEGKS